MTKWTPVSSYKLVSKATTAFFASQECQFDFEVTGSSEFATQTIKNIEVFEERVEMAKLVVTSCPGTSSQFSLYGLAKSYV